MEQVVGETEEIWKLYVNVMLFPAFSALPAEAISTITGNVPAARPDLADYLGSCGRGCRAGLVADGYVVVAVSRVKPCTRDSDLCVTGTSCNWYNNIKLIQLCSYLNLSNAVLDIKPCTFAVGNSQD